MEGLCPHWEGRGEAWSPWEPLPLILHGPGCHRCVKYPTGRGTAPLHSVLARLLQEVEGDVSFREHFCNVSRPFSCLEQPGSHWGSHGGGGAGRRGAGPPGCTVVHRPRWPAVRRRVDAGTRESGLVSLQPQLGTRTPCRKAPDGPVVVGQGRLSNLLVKVFPFQDRWRLKE